jgi:hypothetical protein
MVPLRLGCSTWTVLSPHSPASVIVSTCGFPFPSFDDLRTYPAWGFHPGRLGTSSAFRPPGWEASLSLGSVESFGSLLGEAFMGRVHFPLHRIRPSLVGSPLLFASSSGPHLLWAGVFHPVLSTSLPQQAVTPASPSCPSASVSAWTFDTWPPGHFIVPPSVDVLEPGRLCCGQLSPYCPATLGPCPVVRTPVVLRRLLAKRRSWVVIPGCRTPVRRPSAPVMGPSVVPRPSVVFSTIGGILYGMSSG